MQAATLLKNNLSKKQIIILSSVLGGVLLIAALVFGYFILFGSPFSTRANDQAPANVNINPSPDKANITWETAVETVPVIEYGTSPDPSTFQQLPASSSPSTSHSVELSSLEPGKMYYFQIKVGDTVFDNSGLFWTFSTPTGDGNSGDPDLPVSGGGSEASPSATISPKLSTLPTPTRTASPSGSLTPTIELTPEPTPTVDPNATPTPEKPPVCLSTNCSSIQKNLGNLCSTQDYLKCLFSSQSALTPTDTTDGSTDTATPTTGTTTATTSQKNLCKPTYLQANKCTNFSWSAMADIDKQCEDTFTRYFVQCKSSSFTSSDPSVWYCNQTVTDANSITVPCGNAPTPAPGQQVFCRVRAETDAGGAKNATAWVYADSKCNAYTSSNISACALKYSQSNNCRSFIWDLINSKDPACKDAFSHYFLQCTSNGNFAHLTTTPTPRYWYCNTTTENHYYDLPCYNAPTPADGANIYCRVRAEDGYGTDNHSTDWIYMNDTCPTSTPTPTPTPSDTPTPTPTRTPTPTP